MTSTKQPPTNSTEPHLTLSKMRSSISSSSDSDYTPSPSPRPRPHRHGSNSLPTDLYTIRSHKFLLSTIINITEPGPRQPNHLSLDPASTCIRRFPLPHWEHTNTIPQPIISLAFLEEATTTHQHARALQHLGPELTDAVKALKDVDAEYQALASAFATLRTSPATNFNKQTLPAHGHALSTALDRRWGLNQHLLDILRSVHAELEHAERLKLAEIDDANDRDRDARNEELFAAQLCELCEGHHDSHYCSFREVLGGF